MDCSAAPSPQEKKFLRLAVLIFVALLLLTRLPVLCHESESHPDERHFFQSSVSLRDKLLGEADTYRVSKVYPEGGFVLQLPFQTADYVLSGLMGREQDPRLWGRIASLAYFAAGGVLGMMIVWRFLTRRRSALVLYGLIVVFSLYYIEHSRYGTGDAPSFLLLMATVYASGRFLEEGKRRWLFLSGLAAGMMAAVKYPQLYFACLPAAALALSRREEGSPKRGLWGGVATLAGAVLLGALMLSPSLLVWPGYLWEAVSREATAYMSNGAALSAAEHLAALLVYHLLYADVPFAPVICVWLVVRLGRCTRGNQSALRRFFARALPAAAGVFAAYNLFVGLMVLRTYNPFFALCLLYTAWGLSELAASRRGRAVCAALCLFMAARGGMLLGTLAGPSRSESIESILMADAHWPEHTDVMYMGTYYDTIRMGEFPRIEPGAYAVTMAFEHGLARRGILGGGAQQPIVRGWEAFQRENERYLLRRLYPAWYDWAFGYWVPGSTGAQFEFPSIYLYYRGFEGA